jgi:TrmH family RNA methyltransferase
MKRLELNWRIVLVRPRNPLNIGAAARAWANFGLLEMAVVAPFEPTWVEARTSAVGGERVIASAQAVTNIVEATGDANLVIGTTTGSRRNIGREILPLPEFVAWLRRRKARGKAAILFGSEKTGLSNKDMSLCHVLVRIPTTPECPSMNLAQAVAVFAYELSRSDIVSVRPSAVTVHRSEPANQQALDHIFQHASRVLEASGYFQPKSRGAMLMKLRRTLLDLNLTCNDVRVLGGVLSQVGWKLEQARLSQS